MHVITQGEIAAGLFFIFSGSAKVARRFANEKIERQIDLLESGDTFGEHSVLFRVPSISSVITTMPTTVLFLDNNVVRDLPE